MQNFLKTYFKGDTIIWMAYALLLIISVVVMYSATSTIGNVQDSHISPLWSHVSYLIMGFVVLYVLYRYVPFVWLDKWTIAIYIFAVVILTIATLMGHSENGASRWMSIAGVQFQPSEVAKFAVVLALSKLLTKYQNRKDGKTIDDVMKWFFLVLLPPCFLILRENLSTCLLLLLVSFSLLFFARISWKMIGKIFGISALIVLLIFGSVKLLGEVDNTPTVDKKETVQQPNFITKNFHRVNTWVNRLSRFSEPLDSTYKINDSNYQVSHARIAVANGKWLGLGPGNSIERDFLPQAYADFVFAIIIEEYGLFSVFVILIYLILFYRVGVLIHRNSTSCMQSFVVLGLACLIMYQALINIYVSVGFFPVTGQPLPLISRGGTNIIMTSAYFGIILGISRNCQIQESAEKQRKEKTPTPTVAEEAEKKTPDVVDVPTEVPTV